MSSNILVLDGGMGTTLETLGADISSALWGSEALRTNPDVIRKVHEGYVQAGADLVETATYQLTPQNLCDHLHCPREEAERILCSGVKLAASCITSCSSHNNEHNRIVRGSNNSKIILSFGPYGSTLQPGQEYDGIYPPPFGPSTSTNAFPPDSNDDEEAAIQALAYHHLDKLEAISRDEAAWRKVEWIAFETIPVLHEVRGIRRAMAILRRKLSALYAGGDNMNLWWEKKFWITSPFPMGQHPQLLPDGSHASIPQVIHALFSGPDPIPNGIGINCTNPSYLHSLTSSFASHLPFEFFGKVEMVIYPDGGQVYDTTTRAWVIAPQSPENAEKWAEVVGDVAKKARGAEREGRGIWKGVIAGGCCKSSFDEIRALRRFVDSQ
ncbi:homocysteine S-methyltransferase [Cryptococcus neoformans Ze90-1]|nr:homocysteine S-methyltransferase [Cryptococcus neoformans var. grubii Ze90-1]